MDVLRITPRGFCHGVVDAIRLAQEAGQTHEGPVYMLGYLVHNAHVVQELAQYNVKLIDFDDRLAGLDQIEGGTVILTAHGVSPAVKNRAMDRGLTVIDATCSDVYVTHDLIIDLVDKGYEIIYVGKPGHPEPEGAIGEAPDHVHLVSSTDDVANLDLKSEYIAVTTQTTLSVWDTEDIISSILDKYPDAEVHNDICLATQDRLQLLPASLLGAVDESYQAGDGTWVGFSGRQRVLVYNPNLVDPADLPGSVLDLTDPAYDGRVAVAPANSSFQDFITAMRVQSGDGATLAWLEGMAANDSPNYPKNSAIVDAVLRGEVDMGLVNHYYLLRFLAEDPDGPGINHNFAPDDIGSLLIVTTGAVLGTSDQPSAAQAFIEFMLTRQAQEFYASETREYPLAAGVEPPGELAPLDVAGVMDTIDFDLLGGGLARTQELIDQSGIVR